MGYFNIYAWVIRIDTHWLLEWVPMEYYNGSTSIIRTYLLLVIRIDTNEILKWVRIGFKIDLHDLIEILAWIIILSPHGILKYIYPHGLL